MMEKSLKNIVVMVMKVMIVVVVVMVVMVVAQGCEKNHGPADIQPVAWFRMIPETGNTTTVFRFDADSVTAQGTRDNPVLVRWDWESDGVWEWMYSSGGTMTHRFFKPGSYRIIMEASSLSGKRDTMSVRINVVRGYSPPRAAFSMTPDSANINTEFTFDASLSKDDEDSLDQLEFRWDLNGDGKWETEFSHDTIIKYRYSDDYNYKVRLEARDPQQMTSIRTDTLVVTRLNDRIVPVLTHECWPCTLEDTIRFDAGGSYYRDNPNAKLLFSWDLFSDNLWESTLSASPVFRTWIGLEGKNVMRLRVTDEQGLYMDFVDTVELFPQNSGPVTVLTIGNHIGNTGSRYYLHVRASTDRDDSYLDLKSRWDIDNDGAWEPEYDGLYEIYLTFPAPGKYPVTVMMTDPKNKSGMDRDTVWVTSGTHETGLLEDKRATFLPNYYGTVKIGNRWWMQSNLKYQPIGGGDDWSSTCYNNDRTMKDRYGVLYPHTATYSDNPLACPRGWHVPTLEEWQQLMTDLGADATADRLMEGGRSEMHVLLAGQKEYSSISPTTRDKFSGLGELANFWTSTDNRSGQAYAWYIDPVRKQNKSVIVGKNYWFPIRCIKDE